jgi:Zn-dependent protease with chaperone function
MGLIRGSQRGHGAGQPAGEERLGSLERNYLALGDRLGESLQREMISGESLGPRRTRARSAAVSIAVVIYMAVFALVAVGVAVIVTGWSNGAVVTLGVLLVGIGIVTCPRPYRRSRLRGGVSPSALPELNTAIGAIADALAVRPPDTIVFDLQFNASWALGGWRRRRVLRLGIPLLASLDTGQTLALLAHELAHERNGDARRGLLVGSTLGSLSEAVDLFRGHRTPLGAQQWALVTLLTNGLLWLCSQPFRGLLALQAHLLYRDSQRAEYLADDLAASVAGTDAVIALLDSMLAMRSVQLVIRRVTLTGERAGAEMVEDIRAATCSSDPAGRAARRERAKAERDRLDSTHPTTASRIAVLEQRAGRAPSFVLDATGESALSNELRRVIQGHLRALIDYDRSRLYYG